MERKLLVETVELLNNLGNFKISLMLRECKNYL